MKVRNLKSLNIFFFFFELARKRIFIKMHYNESWFVRGPENTAFRRVLALCSSEIRQAGAVNGLIPLQHYKTADITQHIITLPLSPSVINNRQPADSVLPVFTFESFFFLICSSHANGLYVNESTPWGGGGGGCTCSDAPASTPMRQSA